MDQFVIVADDDRLVIDRAQSVIEQEGFVPVIARDGKQAYKALRSTTQMVAAFLDLEMPYIPGIELVKYMKSEEGLNTVPIVVMNEKLDPELLHEALAAGAIASIQKPFRAAQFRTLLRTIAGNGSEQSIS